MSTPTGATPDDAPPVAQAYRWGGVWLLVLAPAACCGLPLLLGLGTSAAVAGWILGGIAGVALFGAAAVLAAAYFRRPPGRSGVPNRPAAHGRSSHSRSGRRVTPVGRRGGGPR